MKNILFIGLGRIGLPISLVSSSKFQTVYGYDTNKNLISSIKSKKLPFFEKDMTNFLKFINKKFFPISDLEEIRNTPDFIFITFGTKLPEFPKKLNTRSIDKIINKCVSLYGNKPIFVIRTTLPVGTCEKIFKKFNGKLKLSYVPERLAEGNAIYEEKNLPKIVSAFDKDTLDKVAKYFKKIGGNVLICSNPSTAEFCKLVDNSYRNTIFAYSNNTALVANDLNINFSEVLNLVNHKYKRNNIPLPGYVSGYCLAKDPVIFEYSNKSKEESLWYVARKKNDLLYDFAINKIKKLKINTISILGISFKKNIDDFRNSHFYDIFNKIINIRSVKTINLYDPFIDRNIYTKLNLNNYGTKINTYNKIEIVQNIDTDCVMILIDHDEIVNAKFFQKKVIKNKIYTVDIWGAWKDMISKYNFYDSLNKKHSLSQFK